jgi:hypothetical protein
MSILGKLFPETLFPRKLTADAESRLRLAQARAEEALVRTHVENALHFVEVLQHDVSFDRAIDIYIRELGVADPLASVVATRTLVALGEDTETPRAGGASETDIAPSLPHGGGVPIRLDEARKRRGA